MPDAQAAVILAATFLLAGFVKGVIGLGLPTVAVGLLSLTMAPVEAASLLVAPSLVTNLWQLFAGPRFGALLRRLWGMMAGILVGTIGGMRLGLLTGPDAGRAEAALGVALILYAALGLGNLRAPAPGRAEPWLSPLVGALTGLVTAATGVFVIPAVPYLAALGLDKDDLIQALGLSFTVSTVALAAGLAASGAFQVALGGFPAGGVPGVVFCRAASAGRAFGHPRYAVSVAVCRPADAMLA